MTRTTVSLRDADAIADYYAVVISSIRDHREWTRRRVDLEKTRLARNLGELAVNGTQMFDVLSTPDCGKGAFEVLFSLSLSGPGPAWDLADSIAAAIPDLLAIDSMLTEGGLVVESEVPHGFPCDRPTSAVRRRFSDCWSGGFSPGLSKEESADVDSCQEALLLDVACLMQVLEALRAESTHPATEAARVERLVTQNRWLVSAMARTLARIVETTALWDRLLARAGSAR